MPGLIDKREFQDAPEKGLPTIEACRGHLKVLETFVVLREGVEQWARSRQADHNIAWRRFVDLATLRFHQWFSLVDDASMTNSLPPLDILMVWHSFMLNPHAYAEFCTITRPGGAGDGGIPWLPVCQAIDIKSTTFILSDSQIKTIAYIDLSPDLLESLKAQVKTHPDVLELLSAEIDHTETVLSKQALRFSPSVLDLAAAVHRQAAFARKMTRFGWIRSPNVDSMLGRAISRYRNFFSLFAVANHATVPTIDIDLVWHTHQLSPAQYTLYSEKAAQGRFINHNDNIEQADILSAFQSTRALYQRVFGEEYVVCNSWFCEAARSKPTDSGAISESRLTALQSLIKESSLRSPVQLDLAECDCHKVGIHGARGGADRAVASCGDCNSSCNAS